MSEALPGHRRDIDSLRALAIAPVVLYHAGVTSLPGGFLGVDVFFVISGYVITRLLMADLAAGRFSFRGFYLRRVRRLLPALVAVLAAVMAIGWIVFTPSELEAVARSVIATSFFASNVHFWAQRGYFDAADELKPLLMTWSLGIEEQFYVIWPVALLALWRRGGLRRAVWCAAGLSFALACWAAVYRPGAAFYLLPTRAWELLLGAGVALAPAGKAPPRAQDLASLIGLAAMGAAFALLDRRSGIPGLASALPCAGCALVIWAGPQALANRTLLSLRLPVGLGLISYSLYLWHWPLLAGAQLVVGPNRLGAPGVAMIVSAAVGLSILSWRWIEQPFRRAPAADADGRSFARYGLLVSAIVAAAAFVVWQRGFPGRLDPPAQARPGLAQPEAPEAVDKKVVLWGDSEAETLAPGIRGWARGRGRDLVARHHNACPPLLDVDVISDGAEFAFCRQFNDEVFRTLARDEAVETVVLAARWPWYESTRDFGFDRHRVRLQDAAGAATGTSGQVLAAGLARTVSALRGAGKQVVLIGQLPELGFDPLACNERRRLPSYMFTWPTCEMPASRAAQRLGTTDALLAANRQPGVLVLLPSRILCDSIRCATVHEDALLYMNDSHPSEAGAQYLAGFLPR